MGQDDIEATLLHTASSAGGTLLFNLLPQQTPCVLRISAPLPSEASLRLFPEATSRVVAQHSSYGPAFPCQADITHLQPHPPWKSAHRVWAEARRYLVAFCEKNCWISQERNPKLRETESQLIHDKTDFSPGLNPKLKHEDTASN